MVHVAVIQGPGPRTAAPRCRYLRGISVCIIEPV